MDTLHKTKDWLYKRGNGEGRVLLLCLWLPAPERLAKCLVGPIKRLIAVKRVWRSSLKNGVWWMKLARLVVCFLRHKCILAQRTKSARGSFTLYCIFRARPSSRLTKTDSNKIFSLTGTVVDYTLSNQNENDLGYCFIYKLTGALRCTPKLQPKLVPF